MGRLSTNRVGKINSELIFWNSAFKKFQLSGFLVLVGLLIVSASAATTDVRESHLLQVYRRNEENGRSQIYLNPRSRAARSVSPESERNDRAEKQTFRLELLRQIKAIDHMKCFPKILCGLSVDSDKTFGINKSNFVRSYLELMRNIKPPSEGADERLRTQDEVEGDLLWPFSPHNPDRKQHSSFERVSSAANSGSVELADSHEYNSRGFDSRVADSSMSMEKADRKGVAFGSSVEFKEKHSINKMDASKIPGERKKKKNSSKSLTSKITSYFTSWLPEVVSFGGRGNHDDVEDSAEIELDSDDQKRSGRSMKNDDGSSGKSSSGVPSHVIESLRALLRQQEQQEILRQRRTEDDAPTTGTDDTDTEARDDIHADSSEHDSDIYHTAVNIGKRLKTPKQCDYIYNGCPLEYNKILEMISSIRTGIHPLDDTAEAVSHELGFDSGTTTTTTTTTTTKKPHRKKTRPSTKIMHVLPNGEKVEINFRLGGNEDSDESSSAQRKETSDNDSYESLTDEKKHISNRKGSPHIDAIVVKNRNKVGYLIPKRNIMSEMRNEELERTEEVIFEPSKDHRRQETLKSSLGRVSSSVPGGNLKQKLKLSGLTLSTSNNEEQPLEISPSYVIIKHQPLSVHTTSVLSPDNMHQQQQALNPSDRLQTFQLVQNGQPVDREHISDQLKNYIRQNGGLIPKLSLQSSGLITTEGGGDNLPSVSQQHRQEQDAALSSIAQKLQQTYSNRMAALAQESASTMNKLSSAQQSTKTSYPSSSISYNGFSTSYVKLNDGPAMVGSVPGRLGSLLKAKPSTIPTTTTASTTTTAATTTTEKINLPGMQETLTLDTDEITDDTVQKLESQDSVPGWISHAASSASESRESTESDEEQAILENLNKTLLNAENGNGSKSKIQYKNPKKKKISVKANSSSVRNKNRDKLRKKGSHNSGSEEISSESDRVVIKHAGPYNSSPTVYQSPLQGPGPHGGAYPYLPVMGTNVFQGYPFWRMKK